MAKKRQVAWNVFRGKRLIDTVFYDANVSEEEVKKGLIDHDGFPPDIRIEKQ